MGQAARSPVLAVLLALVAALLAWFLWHTSSHAPGAGASLEVPSTDTPTTRREPESAPLEVPENESTGERIAGEPEAPAHAANTKSGVPTAPASARPRPSRFEYRGLVLDLDLDLPLAGAQLVFEGEKARELARVVSDESGRFRTAQLAEEPHWMVIEPPTGYICDEPRLELAGPRGDILVALHRDPATLAGAIRGELLREGGPWTEDTLPKSGSVMLDLVPLVGPRWSRRAELSTERDPGGGFHLRFSFDALPRGEYELTLSSLSAWRWNPTSLRVTPPVDNVTFLRYDLDRTSQLVFKVSDRASGAAIETFQVRALSLTPSQENGVFLHTGPLETSAVPDDARFQWSLWAEGYRPAFGDESAFVRHGGQRIAEIALDRGWATKVLVLVRDPLAKPAARAEIELDGRSQGFTGEDGMLALAAPKPPERLAVRLPGWRMTNDPLQAYNGKNASQRGQVTIVMLEKEK